MSYGNIENIRQGVLGRVKGNAVNSGKRRAKISVEAVYVIVAFLYIL